ncbi:MAG: hypothetical protein MMC33_009763 [Icmadophila ericetorum]|nr:hypothetical protein [Icmadophila ericetorum]
MITATIVVIPAPPAPDSTRPKLICHIEDAVPLRQISSYCVASAADLRYGAPDGEDNKARKEERKSYTTGNTTVNLNA